MTDTFGQPEVTTTTTSYSVDYGPHTTNGHHHDSPDTSRHSVSSAGQDSTQLVSRKQTQHTTQQITTTTKVIRELHHIGPDGEVLDTYQVGDYPYGQAPLQPGYAMDSYRPHSPASEAGSRSRYEGYPPTSNAGYEYDPYSRGPPARQDYPYDQVGYPPQTQAGYSGHYRDATGDSSQDGPPGTASPTTEERRLQQGGTHHQEKPSQKDQKDAYMCACIPTSRRIPTSSCEPKSPNVPSSVYVPSSTCASPSGKSKQEETVQHIAGAKPKMKQNSKGKLPLRNVEGSLPATMQAEKTSFSGHKCGVPCLDASHSLDSPFWCEAEHVVSDHRGGASIVYGKCSGSINKVSDGNLKTHHKPKTKPKPKTLMKGRKITRSLSASCVSVSTNTDPRDFMELAKISATLPVRKKVKEPSKEVTGESANVEVHCSTSDKKESRPEEKPILKIDGGAAPTSGNPLDRQIVSQNTFSEETKMKDVKNVPVEKKDESVVKECEKESSEAVVCTVKGIEKSESFSGERCAGDGCDDASKGYIELPTYVPSEGFPNPLNFNYEHFGCLAEQGSLPGHPYCPTYFMENSSKIMPTDKYFCNYKGIVSPDNRLVVDDEKKFVVNQEENYPPVLTNLTIVDNYTKQQTNPIKVFTQVAGPTRVCEQDKLLTTFKPLVASPLITFQACDRPQDQVDYLYLPSYNNKVDSFQKPVDVSEDSGTNLEVLTPNSEDSNIAHPECSYLVPTSEQHVIQPLQRKLLDKAISIESCPDVVLQTLEGEAQNKSLKKTVTFLLPPEHWDSLISLRESNIGGYPQSGYAELDGTLLPPNGEDPYRNTPSPSMQGIPQDRYDGGLEGDVHVGDYPEDSRYPGAESGGMVYPPDGVVYGRLLGAPRSPYTINGGVRASAEPLLPSPAMYDEEPPHVQHPAPPPHISPSTPSLPPPPKQNHDNYAHPNLLRSPSADSSAPRVRWRDPDLHEVIDFLSNPNNVVKANAAAYLQHLCYMDDTTKQKTRILGGIPPLVALLTHDLPELHRNACGALRNLSYGRQNDENKRAIKDAQGIPSLVRLLRKTPDNEIKELVTGILWNLSSCEDLKHSIIDDALTVTVTHVIIPCSGWDGGEVERDPNVDVWWSTVFKNASGVLRNVSSAGEYARTKLRQCLGLVDSLLTVIKSAIQGSSHDNKSVENCVCILRNLSYRCQEVEDPNYDKNQPPTQSRATATAKDGEGEGTDTCGRSSEPKDNLCDNLGCFGGSRKKKEAVGGAVKETSAGQRTTGPRTEPLRGMELLWQPEVVVGPYLALLSDCSNPETLEAAAGALQNLAACYWQPSIDVRAAVRKEKGLPILVELLRMEVDRVVCAVATALRNLAIDQRNKELIGKYAMRDLVQKLPSGNTHDSGTSDETIAAVLATLNEVIKKSAEFSRSLLDVGGVERLVNMTRHRGRYSVRVVKFASQVLFSMWGHQELREVYKKAGWKEQDFVSKSVAARNAASGGANSPTANNTLNRPMASQGGTRYEDRTIQRGQAKAHQRYAQGQELPMADMGYGSSGGVGPPAGGDIGVPQH
ncbi:uncharacterized protein LOC121862091 isoform X7 [Homarus americanus]|uniref:uncharacterized protein LOC121862091 isoform X7 n=1 Tax=Homarus americanus TaxID=6706 RepID=UPI001C436A34|nr:uncharacterized protein LOC121862091 isoform X7 [Homarus americanus]XP_042215984.1 uncharacterized protein LOC121862091 isoform X7 [Homarus americanus]XP_042215985.1 uncharacterized protein LOC121862091 isoform X7 [Homarus americanus]